MLLETPSFVSKQRPHFFPSGNPNFSQHLRSSATSCNYPHFPKFWCIKTTSPQLYLQCSPSFLHCCDDFSLLYCDCNNYRNPKQNWKMSKCQIITTSYNILNPTQPCFCTLIPLVLKTLGDQPNFASPKARSQLSLLFIQLWTSYGLYEHIWKFLRLS